MSLLALDLRFATEWDVNFGKFSVFGDKGDNVFGPGSVTSCWRNDPALCEIADFGGVFGGDVGSMNVPLSLQL